jgi:hypothetical protein
VCTHFAEPLHCPCHTLQARMGGSKFCRRMPLTASVPCPQIGSTNCAKWQIRSSRGMVSTPAATLR